MSNENQVLIIDAGNTVIKVASIVDGHVVHVTRFPSNEPDVFYKAMQDQQRSTVVLSSVLSPERTKELIHFFSDVFVVNHATPLPIHLEYETTHTLGIDRICNAVYAYSHSKTPFSVAIDIGTCIKFDLVNHAGSYLGGSISPGIELRYKSLNDYTDNLPLLHDRSRSNLVGTSTTKSIHSGVMNGMQAEIQGTIDRYQSQFEDLTFFVTGGDATFFDIVAKNDIFADENLTVKGLYEIYKHNA